MPFAGILSEKYRVDIEGFDALLAVMRNDLETHGQITCLGFYFSESIK